ncbi:Pentatricopeptide repeat [Macleaya cordata]|uniref:Pentatricopeptide repeat n=1 Tax=Macleaya cordata TaxID=56857 RepID=A0A200RDU5_MACCD|nr:Pentatricopeptide repeat [Macleaya cordata]
MITNGLNCRKDPSIVGKLVENFCAVSEGINYAHLIYRDQPKNLYILNVMIKCMPFDKAIKLFTNETVNLVFDEFTYIFVLGTCARSSSSDSLSAGKQIHTRIFKIGFVSDITIQTTAINFYAKNGDLISARKMFDEMPVRTSATWNAMITGYCSQGKTLTSNAHQALMLFRKMLLESCSVKPTDVTLVGVLSACSRLGILATGISVHGFIHKTIYVPEDDIFISTGLVDMYSKCGCIRSAESVFKRMKEKNVLTWTSMVAGLALHGQGKEALEMLSSMETDNVKPNAVTFTNLLFGCCHSGLVEEGLYLFNNMSSKFGIEPQIQHYGCIVDLLGRAGRIKETYEFIIGMKIEPDEILWRSLLGSCKIHGDVVMGEKVGKLLLKLQSRRGKMETSSSCEDFIALSNVYAEAERWDDVVVVREMMKIKGIQTKPGCSFV